MKNIILKIMITEFIKVSGRHPTEEEVTDLGANAEIFTRDLKRIIKADVRDYIAQNKNHN